MLQGSTAFNFGRTPVVRRGFGAADPYADEPWLGHDTPSTTGGSTPKKSTWDTVNEGLNTLSNLWSSYKSGQGSGGADPGGGGAPAPKNNTVKYVLIGTGVLAAVGLTAWAISASKKKKK